MKYKDRQKTIESVIHTCRSLIFFVECLVILHLVFLVLTNLLTNCLFLMSIRFMPGSLPLAI